MKVTDQNDRLYNDIKDSVRTMGSRSQATVPFAIIDSHCGNPKKPVKVVAAMVSRAKDELGIKEKFIIRQTDVGVLFSRD